MPGPDRRRAGAGRWLCAGTALLVAALAATPLRAADEPDRWFRIELLVFAQGPGVPPSVEDVRCTRAPQWPATLTSLDDGNLPRPQNLGQLAAAWQSLPDRPDVRIIPPGYAVELDRLLDWLRDGGRTATPELTAAWLAEVAAAPLRLPVPPPPPPVEAVGATVAPAPAPVATGPQPAPGPTPAGDVPTAAPATPAAPAMPTALLRQPPDGFELAGEWRRMERKGFRRLWHAAWWQPLGEDESWAVAIEGDSGLRGTLAMSVRRFLHATLALDAVVAVPGRGPQPVAVCLSADRRMRSREVHYFDHPAVGALLVTVPLEVAPTMPAPQPTSPILGPAGRR